MESTEKLIYWHDLPALCRAGKIAPAPSFLATKAFVVIRVRGQHPILEWFAIYVFDNEGTNNLGVRAIEPETYVDVEHPNPFNPEDPVTFSLMAQAEVQYTLPAHAKTPEQIGALLQSVCVAVLEGRLIPDGDYCQTWYRALDRMCDTLVWQ